MLKRFLSILSAIAIIMTAVPASAQNDIVCISEKPVGGKAGIIGEGTNVGDDFTFASFYSTATDKTLNETLEEGLLAHNTAIDIRKYGIPNTDAGRMELLDALSEVIFGNYNIICFTGYNHNYSGGIITEVKPYYILSSYEDDVAARKAMDAKIDEYIELVSDVPEFIGKMLVIHDEFARACRYSTAELTEFDRKMAIRNEYIDDGKSIDLIPEEDKLTTEDFSIYTPFRLFTKNNAVCQGNAIALNAIYRRLAEECGETDFDSVFCYNDNHVWNMIKTGGKWYHLDETWNDPDVIAGTDADGNIILADKCMHEYFMVSDAMMQDHSPEEWGYYGYEGDSIVCGDTRYEGGHIFNGENEYGGWYGNISYENGRYKINVLATIMNGNKGIGYYPTGYPMFYSRTAKSYGLIASDIIISGSNGTTTKTVSLFANDAINETPDARCVFYQDGQILRRGKWNLGDIDECWQDNLQIPVTSDEIKVIIWKNGTQEPLCEAIEIN